MHKQILSILLALGLVGQLFAVTAMADGTGGRVPLGNSAQGAGVSALARGAVWDGTTKSEPIKLDDVFQIGSAAELAWFSSHVNGPEGVAANAVLTADIDLGGYIWMPIGTKSYPAEQYAGTFDGQCHAIRGLRVEGDSANQGLFGAVNGATIRNLVVEGSVSSSKSYVGGIVGLTRGATIQNCSFDGSVTGSGNVGGIIGGNMATASQISGCVNMATLRGATVGGILGDSSQKNTITNCYNTGAITGTGNAGGIVGRATAGSITSCYNIGEVAAGSTTSGGTFGFSSAAITNCYHLYPTTEKTAGVPKGSSVLLTGPEGLLARLGGDAFVADADDINDGYPLLGWQTPPDLSPSISLSGDSTLYVDRVAGATETTLVLDTKNMEAEELGTVSWAVETAKGDAEPQEIVAWQTADNSQQNLIVTAKQGGVVTVTATAAMDGETLTASRTVAVIPQITTAEIVNVRQPGAVAIGQTVEAKVYVLGGGEYDYDNYPELSYAWRYKSPTAADIGGATARSFAIPTDAGYSEWDYLYLELRSGGVVVKEAQDVRGQLRSADYGRLYPVAYAPDFVLPEKVKDSKPLVLPTTRTVDGVTATVSWSSDHAAIDAATGRVTVPQTGTTTVTLTARCQYGTASANRTFAVRVYSAQAAESESNASYLEQAAAALGEWYGPMIPTYGSDSNLAEMLQAELAAKGYADLSVAVGSVTERQDGAGVAPNGDITYFYADPNSTRGVWFGQYAVTFVLSKGVDRLELADVVVNVGWDKSRAEALLRSQILGGITEELVLAQNNGRDNVIADLVLPKVVSDQRWAGVAWSSSDPSVVSVSAQNQGTADTLFDPYVGKVIRGAADRQVTLTAKCTLNRTALGQPEIVLYKTFTFTVVARTDAETDAIRAELLEQLDAGLAAVGLRDSVTGERLAATEGVYPVRNDIQLPTTRDFGVDGKYFPITMTSSDDALLAVPEVANAARVTVYRPAVGGAAQTATLTLSITDLARGVSASKRFDIEALPLEQAELDDALALMDRAKTAYFEGLSQGRYPDEYAVTGSLQSFREATWDADKSGLRWVYDERETTGSGIVADELDNWAEQEAWRAFRSSDMELLDHETLNLVAQPANDTFVRINSVLTHAVYGKYAGLPGYEGLESLYKQPVSVYVMVWGKHHPQRTAQELERLREEAVARISTPIAANFTLLGVGRQSKARSVAVRTAGDALIETTVDKLEAGTTVFGLFRTVLAEQGYSYSAVGSYVKSVTDADGNTLAELDNGPNSGWIYTVNGKMPTIYMNGYSLKAGDVVVVRFTNDYTKEDAFGGGAVDKDESDTDTGLVGGAVGGADKDAGAKLADGIAAAPSNPVAAEPPQAALQEVAPPKETAAADAPALSPQPDVAQPAAEPVTEPTAGVPALPVVLLLLSAALVGGLAYIGRKQKAGKQ